jgi:ferredoxin
MRVSAATPEVDDSTNRRARERALAAVADWRVRPTGVVNYRSAGRLLLVADARAVLERTVAETAAQQPCVLLLGEERVALRPGTELLRGRRAEVRLSGWLGEFELRTGAPGDEILGFDLVLDLLDTPLIGAALPPPGYFAPRGDARALASALEQLPALAGEFEKPRYFAYDPSICAHGMKGMEACRRCVDACPAEAITSLSERIEVDPHLCQGGGACATACPSGALTYAYPGPGDSLERVRRLLGTYRSAGGRDAVLLLHDSTSGAQTLGALERGDPLPGRVLPFAAEEVASLGLEFWLSAIAYGARSIRLLDTPQIPAQARQEVDRQLAYARTILVGLGYPEKALGWLAGSADLSPEMPPIEPASYAGLDAKRQVLYLAVDHLHVQAPRPRPLVELPAGAPFGTAAVDEKACTLCLSCVTVCPGRALQDGHDRPQLRFIEANCLQCGMCTRACPEDAIWISPRMLFDAAQRSRARLLREEAPFLCIGCGKPFATRSVIGRMEERLAAHWMFQGQRARNRLRMCADCRVIDMVREEQQAS